MLDDEPRRAELGARESAASGPLEGARTGEIVASDPASSRSAPALPLRVLVLPCFGSFIAWEVARLGLEWLPQALPSAPLTSPFSGSLVRAVLLLAPAAIVARRVLGERLVPAFWLGAPERAGWLRSGLIGVAYLLLVNGLDLALGNPFTLPSFAASTLVLTAFDAGVEEALFRGFLLSHLARGRSPARAQLLTASIFLLPHAPKLVGFWGMGMRVELPVMALAIFVLGLALGGTARPVRSIWIATLVHTLNNLLATR